VFRDRVVPWRIGMAVKTCEHFESEVLARYVEAQRWYAAKGEPVKRAKLAVWALWEAGRASCMLALLEIEGATYFVPLTLAFNRGAAFGIRIGDDSRWFFVPVTIVALMLLATGNVLLRLFHAPFRGTYEIVSFLGAIGVAFALHQTPLIFWFVLFAWSGLGAAFGPVLLCGLWYPKTTLRGAIAGMLGGFLTTVGWVLWLKPLAWNLLEVIPGFAVGLLLTVFFSRRPGRSNGPPDPLGDET